ncbi:MAG TPA: hypothetical protein DEO73_04050 [Pantoea sp.]|nr:hypothetical protein [Pantoea sp.]
MLMDIFLRQIHREIRLRNKATIIIFLYCPTDTHNKKRPERRLKIAPLLIKALSYYVCQCMRVKKITAILNAINTDYASAAIDN